MYRAVLCFLPLFCHAQTAFEAASIKPVEGGDGVHWSSDPGRLVLTGMSLRNLVITAYGLKNGEYSGPAWLDSVHYTVEAKSPARSSEKEKLVMLQALLADRFKLVTHRETRQVSGYALVVAKGGLKMQRSKAEGSESHGSGNKLTATNLDMARIARHVERVVGEPVIDETHLTVGYDFVLEYTRENRAPSDDLAALPTIFTALPEQLGLKLESRKVPIEMLIVDRCERPTEN